MSWLKVDDGFSEHPKVVAAGRAAIGLWVELACYSARALTDGFISKAQADRYDGPEEIKALLRVGLLDRARGGYQLHDYLDWNKSKETILGEREATRLRVEEHRKKRSGNAVQTPDNSVSVTPYKRGGTAVRSSPPLKGEKSPRRKGAAGSNITPIKPEKCPIHSPQPLPCIGCAADAKAGA